MTEDSLVRIDIESHECDPESLAELLIEYGSVGSELKGSIVCCFAPQSARGDLLRFVAAQGSKVLDTIAVPTANWHEQCAELFTPLPYRRFRIVPLASSSEKPAQSCSGDLYIIPGCGFGTGHHQTTNRLLGWIDSYEGRPRSICDVGTGSAILALAAWKTLSVPVRAIDNDPMAVENATENVGLNGAADAIEVDILPISRLRETYPLVLANLYAEVLVSLEPELLRITAPTGELLVSGIAAEKERLVLDAYGNSNGWKLERRENDGGWISLSYVRRTQKDRI